MQTIKKDYGSQKDFTQVWNSTMEGVRWAGEVMEWGERGKAPVTPSPPCLQLKCCGFNNYTDFEESPYFTENKVFPPYCCSDDVNGTEPCTKKRAEDKPVQVGAGMGVWGCFNGLRVPKVGGGGAGRSSL